MTIERRRWVHPNTKLPMGEITRIVLSDGRWASHYGQSMTDDEAVSWAIDQLEAPDEE